jgi:hypothetical protein
VVSIVAPPEQAAAPNSRRIADRRMGPIVVALLREALLSPEGVVEDVTQPAFAFTAPEPPPADR